MILVNRKGEIGQTLTTIVVLFIVFFLMTFFVIVASISGLVGSKDAGRYSELGNSLEESRSRVLLELFLTDEIEGRGLRDKVLVSQALEMIVSGDERKNSIMATVEEKFEEEYSCGGKNILIFSSLGGGNDIAGRLDLHIEFPEGVTETFGRSSLGGGYSYPQDILGGSDGFYTKETSGGRITVKGVERC